jgi:hypothetical protein
MLLTASKIFTSLILNNYLTWAIATSNVGRSVRAVNSVVIFVSIWKGTLKHKTIKVCYSVDIYGGQGRRRERIQAATHNGSENLMVTKWIRRNRQIYIETILRRTIRLLLFDRHI